VPGVSFGAQLGARAQQRLGSIIGHEYIPDDLDRLLYGPAHDHRRTLGLGSDLTCLFHGLLTSSLSCDPPYALVRVGCHLSATAPLVGRYQTIDHSRSSATRGALGDLR